MAYNALQGTFEKIMQKNLVKCLHISNIGYTFAIERFTDCELGRTKRPAKVRQMQTTETHRGLGTAEGL